MPQGGAKARPMGSGLLLPPPPGVKAGGFPAPPGAQQPVPAEQPLAGNSAPRRTAPRR